MAGAPSSVKGVLANFATPILTNIGRNLTSESLIDLHVLISGNATFVASNLGGGQNGNLALTMTAKEYTEQMGYSFVPPHNPVNLRTNVSNRSRASAQKRKVLTKPSAIQKINRRGRIPKNRIIAAVQPVFLSPLVDQLTVFGHISAIAML